MHIPPLNRASLITAIRRGWRPEYIHFWRHAPHQDGVVAEECLAQGYPASFSLDGQTYATAEHYLMAQRALLFEDLDLHDRITRAASPGLARHLGNEVSIFDEERWEIFRREIAVLGNWAKFGQHQILHDYLIRTGDSVLVEANPVDPIFGIGLRAEDPRALDPEQWQGINLQGFALMEVRRLLRGA